MQGEMADSKTLAADSHSTADKRKDRLNRLRELQLKRNQARKLNHEEVVEEDRRKKLPSNWETKRKFVEWEVEQQKAREDCTARGEDYDRVKLLSVSADEAQRWEAKKRRKNPDPGFSTFENAAIRQYQRMTKEIKPDMEDYKKQKEEKGEAFYPTVDTMGVNDVQDSEEAIDSLVTAVDKIQKKRAKFSRRRAHDDEADVDSINERNAQFNKKLERFYGQYTVESKQNLERGTAV